MNKRDLGLEVLKRNLGLPYRWGGNDPMYGFDCSGLMIEVLKSVGIVERNFDTTSDGLSRLFPETDILQPGVMVYWDWDKDGKVDHVEMIASVDDNGEIYTVGASGGGSATTSLDSAAASDAYVKVRPLRAGYLLANDPFEGK